VLRPIAIASLLNQQKAFESSLLRLLAQKKAERRRFPRRKPVKTSLEGHRPGSLEAMPVHSWSKPMAREPHYPDADATVGSAKPDANAGVAAPSPAAKVSEAAPAKPVEGKRNKQMMAGAAIGIGSAAIVAALLYANRKPKTGSSDNG
jgi:hypothetical protein